MLTSILLIVIVFILLLYLRDIVTLLNDINKKMDSVRYFIKDYEKNHNCDK